VTDVVIIVTLIVGAVEELCDDVVVRALGQNGR
jgi:hypothetical protein